MNARKKWTAVAVAGAVVVVGVVVASRGPSAPAAGAGDSGDRGADSRASGVSDSPSRSQPGAAGAARHAGGGTGAAPGLQGESGGPGSSGSAEAPGLAGQPGAGGGAGGPGTGPGGAASPAGADPAAARAGSPALAPSNAPPLPYRPANLLRFSDAPPAANPGDDDASPVLRRILNVTEATPEQQAQIRELWHAHEDGRRTLQAAAPPRQSGPPVLDLRKLQELDFRFESSVVAGVLQPQQRDRLVAEIYPQQK